MKIHKWLHFFVKKHLLKKSHIKILYKQYLNGRIMKDFCNFSVQFMQTSTYIITNILNTVE